jgi:hypothetical protein
MKRENSDRPQRQTAAAGSRWQQVLAPWPASETEPPIALTSPRVAAALVMDTGR